MLRKKTSLTIAVIAGAGLAMYGCGDDGGDTVDARRFDAPRIFDSPPEFDAAPATYNGTLTLLEAEALVSNGSGGTVTFGQGPSFRMAFVDPAAVGAPVLEENPGSPFGCKAFQYTPAQFAATLGVDVGPIDITFTAGPVVPTCVYVPGSGYTCPDPATASAGNNAAIGPGPTATTKTYTDTDFALTDDVLGRYLVVTGATNAANNGAFPILARPAATTLLIASATAVADPMVGGNAITVAGVGPIPQVPDPGFITNAASIGVDLVSQVPNGFPSFSGTVGDVGDDFILDDANKLALVTVPVNGSAFVVDCEPNCGSATSSVLNVLTTDAPVAGLGPFTMPPPVTTAVLVRCTSSLVTGTGDVTIPAAYSAFIMGSGATRIQATFVRGALGATGGVPSNRLTLIGGHSSVGFTTVP